MDVKDITGAWDNKGDIVIGNDVWIGFEALFYNLETFLRYTLLLCEEGVD